MTATKISAHRRQAFVLTADDAGELNKATRAFLGDAPEFTISVECKDEVVRSFSDIKGLREYDNAPKKAITKLKIAGHSPDWKKQVIVSLSEQQPFQSNVTYYIEGADRAPENLKDRLDEILAGMAPWYAWIAAWNMWRFLIGVGGLVTILGVLWWGYVIWTGALAAHFAALEGDKILKTIFILLYFTGLLSWLSGFRAWLFPLTVFAIGQGKRRHEKFSVWQTFILFGVLAALLISIVGSMIAARL